MSFQKAKTDTNLPQDLTAEDINEIKQKLKLGNVSDETFYDVKSDINELENNVNQDLETFQIERQLFQEQVNEIVNTILNSGTVGKIYFSLDNAINESPKPDDGTPFSVIDETNLSENGYYAFDSSETEGVKFARKFKVPSFVESINVLKLKSGNNNLETIFVSGYYTKNDGGGGFFNWDSTSQEADNGGTIIQSTGVTLGRWKRVYSGHIDPRWFGALYDGTTDCSNFINKAISVGGKVKLIGNGVIAICAYPISLSVSGAEIHADKNFTIKLADGANCELIKTPGVEFYWDSTDVNSNIVSNIMVSGGIWDGNEANQIRSASFTGHHLRFADVNNLYFGNLTIKNPTAFGFQAGNLNKFKIENIYLDFNKNRPNQDGIHLNGGCFDGYIYNIYGLTNDDLVALNAADGLEYQLRKGDIKRVKVDKISSSGYGFRAVRLLTDEIQIVDEISISDIFGGYSKDAILLSSYRGFSAKFGRINISNVFCSSIGLDLIKVKEGAQPCEIDSLLISNVNYKYFAGNTPKLLNTEGFIKNLTISNVHIDNTDIDLLGLTVIDYFGDGRVGVLILNNIIFFNSFNRTILAFINLNVSKIIQNNIKGNFRNFISLRDNCEIIESNIDVNVIRNYISQRQFLTKLTNPEYILDSETIAVHNPINKSFSSPVYGAIKIKLPVLYTDTFISFSLEIRNHADNSFVSILIAGYNFTTDGWLNVNSTIISSNDNDYKVRFGNDNSKTCIWVGETNNNWNRPQIKVTDFLGSFNNANIKWVKNWEIGISTAFENIDIVKNNNLPFSDFNKMKNKQNGASGTFTTSDSKTVTVNNGFIISIV